MTVVTARMTVVTTFPCIYVQKPADREKEEVHSMCDIKNNRNYVTSFNKISFFYFTQISHICCVGSRGMLFLHTDFSSHFNCTLKMGWGGGSTTDITYRVRLQH